MKLQLHHKSIYSGANAHNNTIYSMLRELVNDVILIPTMKPIE